MWEHKLLVTKLSFWIILVFSFCLNIFFKVLPIEKGSIMFTSLIFGMFAKILVVSLINLVSSINPVVMYYCRLHLVFWIELSYILPLNNLKKDSGLKLNLCFSLCKRKEIPCNLGLHPRITNKKRRIANKKKILLISYMMSWIWYCHSAGIIVVMTAVQKSVGEEKMILAPLSTLLQITLLPPPP